jgi:hypothetical protein
VRGNALLGPDDYMARAAIAARIQQSQRANEGYRPSPSLTMPSRSVEPLSRSIMPDRYNNAILQGSNWVNEKARYLMGPHLSRPVETLARAGGLLSVGADLREGMKSSGDTVNSLLSGDLGEAGSNALMTAYTPLGMLIPGTINSVTSAAKGIVNRVKGAAQSPLGFRSKLRESAEALQPNMTTEQARSGLLKSGVKPDEMKFTGTNELLAEPGKISRNELLDHIDENAIDVQEVTLGESTARQLTEDEAWELSELTARDHATNGNLSGDELQRFRALSRTSEELYSGGPKHAEQQLPGGENYREVLLTMPPPPSRSRWQELKAKVGGRTIGSRTADDPSSVGLTADEFAEYARLDRGEWGGQLGFTGGHYGEHPNVLAHIRMNDRTGPNGERILNIEEIQSDWGQQGRNSGFADGGLSATELDELRRLEKSKQFATSQAHNFPIADEMRFNELSGRHNPNAVPTGPFVGNTDKWTSLALKRIIRKASDEGYDRVTFTTGKIQNDRYDLSKQISDIQIRDTNSGRVIQVNGLGGHPVYTSVYDDSGKLLSDGEFQGKNLSDVIGKEMADKIMGVPPKGESWVVINNTSGKHSHHFATEKEAYDFAHEFNDGFEAGNVRVSKFAGSNSADVASFSGKDLEIGGEGMKAFYDTIIPKNLKKILKKLDPNARVGKTRVRTAGSLRPVFGGGDDPWHIFDPITHDRWVDPSDMRVHGYASEAEAAASIKGMAAGPEVWSIDITPKMRGEAKKGQHLFSAGLLGAGAAGGGLLSAYGGQGRQEQVY